MRYNQCSQVKRTCIHTSRNRSPCDFDVPLQGKHTSGDVVIVLPMRCSTLCFVDAAVKSIISRVPVDDSGATAAPLYLYLVTICHVTFATAYRCVYFVLFAPIRPNAFCPLKVLCSNRAEILFDEEIIRCFCHGIS